MKNQSIKSESKYQSLADSANEVLGIDDPEQCRQYIEESIDLLDRERTQDNDDEEHTGNTEAYIELLRNCETQEERDDVMKDWADEMAEVRKLREDLDLVEAILALSGETGSTYQRSMAKMALNDIFKKEENESERHRTIELDGSKIGWINTEEKIEVGLTLVEHADEQYWFGSIIELNNITQKNLEKIERSGKKEEKLEKAQTDYATKIVKALRDGKPGDIRTWDINTIYPAYKDYIGSTETLGVFIAFRENEHEHYTVILVALYLHKFDRDVNKALGL